MKKIAKRIFAFLLTLSLVSAGIGSDIFCMSVYAQETEAVEEIDTGDGNEDTAESKIEETEDITEQTTEQPSETQDGETETVISQPDTTETEVTEE